MYGYFLGLVECFSLTVRFQLTLATNCLAANIAENHGVKLILKLLLIITMCGQTGFVLYEILIVYIFRFLKM